MSRALWRRKKTLSIKEGKKPLFPIHSARRKYVISTLTIIISGSLLKIGVNPADYTVGRAVSMYSYSTLQLTIIIELFLYSDLTVLHITQWSFLGSMWEMSDLSSEHFALKVWFNYYLILNLKRCLIFFSENVLYSLLRKLFGASHCPNNNLNPVQNPERFRAAADATTVQYIQ